MRFGVNSGFELWLSRASSLLIATVSHRPVMATGLRPSITVSILAVTGLVVEVAMTVKEALKIGSQRISNASSVPESAGTR
jgi:hypothetical protein